MLIKSLGELFDMIIKLKRIVIFITSLALPFVIALTFTGCENNLESKLTAHKWSCEINYEIYSGISGEVASVDPILVTYEFKKDGTYLLAFDYRNAQDYDVEYEEEKGYWKIEKDKSLSLRGEDSSADAGWHSYKFYELTDDEISSGTVLSSKSWFVSNYYFLFHTFYGFGAFTPISE